MNMQDHCVGHFFMGSAHVRKKGREKDETAQSLHLFVCAAWCNSTRSNETSALGFMSQSRSRLLFRSFYVCDPILLNIRGLCVSFENTNNWAEYFFN